MEIGSIAHQVKSGFLDETYLDILKLGYSALTTTAVYLKMSRQEAKGILREKGGVDIDYQNDLYCYKRKIEELKSF